MPTVTVMVSDCGQYCAAGEWWHPEVKPRHASCPQDNLHLTGKNDLQGLKEAGREIGGRRLTFRQMDGEEDAVNQR